MSEFLPPKPSWLSEPPPVERLRHCWVNTHEHGQVPALLLQWRQTPDGWQARVVRPVLDAEDGKWRKCLAQGVSWAVLVSRSRCAAPVSQHEEQDDDDDEDYRDDSQGACVQRDSYS